MDKTYLIELLEIWRLFGTKETKNYHNRDLKPKLWDEIGEKLDVAVKYWNNNTDEMGHYLLIYTQYL